MYCTRRNTTQITLNSILQVIFSLDVFATSMSVPKSNEALDNCLSTCTKSQYFQVCVSLQDTTKPGNQ